MMSTSSPDLVCSEGDKVHNQSPVSKVLEDAKLFGQFTELLRSSTGIEGSQAYKIVRLIQNENRPNGLKSMSNDAFIDKAKFIIKHKIQNQTPFCSFCLKTFKNSKDRNNHVKIIHEKIKEEKLCCRVCEKSFMSKIALKYHVDVSHSSSSPEVKCKVCGAMIGHEVSLKRHMKLHKKNPNIYQCKKCPKEFNRKDNLTVHLKVVHKLVDVDTDMVELFRQEDESFACKVCGYVFSGNEADKNLVEHFVRKCKPEERFPCSECGKDFSSKFNLEQHKRNIHYEVPRNIFSCKYCDFISKHKTSMTRHVKRKHESSNKE